MIVNFARLLIKGVTTALLSLIILHTLVSYIPGGATHRVLELRRGGDPVWPLYLYPTLVIELLELDRPFPFSSLAWLFDPAETESYSMASRNGIVSTGININIAGVSITGSGVLTGDLGESLIYQPGIPVMDIIGKGTDEYLLAHLAVLFIAMIIACVQRLGRPKLHELPARLLPSLSATRSAAQPGAMCGWHAARSLGIALTKV